MNIKIKAEPFNASLFFWTLFFVGIGFVVAKNYSIGIGCMLVSCAYFTIKEEIAFRRIKKSRRLNKK